MTVRTTAQEVEKRSGRRLRAGWTQLRHNPVALKELRGRMRGGRATLILSLYLGILSVVLALVYFTYWNNAQQRFGPPPQLAGQPVFITLLLVQIFLTLFIGPAFTAGAISGERERRTFDLLRTTLLPTRRLATGKLLSALAYTLLLMLTTLPLVAMAFLLGGISVAQIMVAELVLVVSAIVHAAWGLYASTRARSTLAATIITYAGILAFLVALPIIAAVVAASSAFSFAISDPPVVMQAALFYGGIILAALNLPATLILAQTFYDQSDSIFYLVERVSGPTASVGLVLPSPWILYVIFNLILAWILWRATATRLRRFTGR